MSEIPSIGQCPATRTTRIGAPDLPVLFTGTMSHKMLRSVLEETRGQNLRIARCHQSSMAALRGILDAHAGGGVNV